MSKVAVILASGFEEIEALTVVDVLRRAAIECQMVGFDPEVTGSHGITVKVDEIWSGSLDHFDGIVLPGGMPGAANLRDHEGLIQSLKEAHEQGKSLAAICAAPIVLDRAGVLDEKHYTCYDGFEKEIVTGHYVKEAVVQDGHILTSRGPATALAFSYALVNHFGGDAAKLRAGMLYQDVFGTSAP